jgi:hypothetical protein
MADVTDAGQNSFRPDTLVAELPGVTVLTGAAAEAALVAWAKEDAQLWFELGVHPTKQRSAEHALAHPIRGEQQPHAGTAPTWCWLGWNLGREFTADDRATYTAAYNLEMQRLWRES